MLFYKPEYREMLLPFIYIDFPEDMEGGGISVEAYGEVFGSMTYCYACYTLKKSKMYVNGEFEELKSLMGYCEGKKVRAVFKLKKGKTADFKIDLESLAECFGDERIKHLELASWGMNDKSAREVFCDN